MILVVCSKIASGQDPQFSQPYASPLYLNPALTGDTRLNRVSITYRKQWAAIESGFNSYMASFDQYKKKINSGFGGYLLYDQTGMNGFRVTGVTLCYSYDVKIDRWSGIKGGLSLGYSYMNFNKSDLLFADQIIRDGAATSVEENINDHSSYFDMGVGAIYYSNIMWAGMAVSHLNSPNISVTGLTERLPIKYSIHGGAKLWAKRGNWGKELSSIHIVAHYKFQAKWDQLDIGTYLNLNPIVVGLWYRGIPVIKNYDSNYKNHESIILLVGLDYKEKFRIGYSYDITISQLSMSSGGSHEITLTYEWPGNSKKSRLRRVACPKF